MQRAHDTENWHDSEIVRMFKPDLEATEEMRHEGGGNSRQERLPHLMQLWHYSTLISIPKNRAYPESVDYTVTKS